MEVDNLPLDSVLHLQFFAIEMENYERCKEEILIRANMNVVFDRSKWVCVFHRALAAHESGLCEILKVALLLTENHEGFIQSDM